MHIRNFQKVNDWLYRGGQPGHEGIEELAAMGIKTVISLRWGAKIVEAERKAVEAAGMEFISIRLNYWNLPNQPIIDSFLSTLDNEDRRPVFVHARAGVSMMHIAR
jgi:protein tyrosine phosphatase (PTP) superfamily phosphohydrolase (DUF442 family)